MKPRLFPPGGVGIVFNSFLAIDDDPACSARTGWHAGAATQADSMLPDPCRVRVRLQAHTATQARGIPREFPATLPATPLPDEKIHRFHLARYGSGLVWVSR
jgi:hypothetical protein